MERKNVWKDYDKKEKTKLEKLSKDYRHFLNVGKTERECVKEMIRVAEEAGYVDLEEIRAKKQTIKAGDKIYSVCMSKSVALFHIGDTPMEEGMNILGAHIDSPRLDVKQNPLYEKEGFAYLDTHYYGGIKKYQWATIPLAIHGVIAKKDGSVVEVCIGEGADDPVFCVTDLLVHLAANQQEKKANKVIEGENLDILFGSMPLAEEEKDAVKGHVAKLLQEYYDMEEEDFLSAELEIVPAGEARDCGLDRSMIIGYGQDDRVCAYTSFVAMMETKRVKKTACCLLVDKEEIGSVGATGMRSKFFENAVAEVMDAMGDYSELKLRRCLSSSYMLSSDVTAAYDPLYSEAYEKKNTAFFGRGIAFSKFTGSRGKSGSNDANAEYIAKLRRIMDNNQVAFQTAELGKVDVGGGGTIAYILALYGMQVIDSGVAVLNMHAPWEVTSKADLYEAKKCYMAFLKDA